jgi:hypothetical protein
MKRLLKITFIVFLSAGFMQIMHSCKKSTEPAVSTGIVSDITYSSAVSGGTVQNDGGEAITSRGVCWRTSQNPTISNSKTTDGEGIGSFISNLTGLKATTKYYLRAYATNSVGTGYGNELSFTTDSQCLLECDIDTEGYAIGISCESGNTTTTFNNQRTEYQYDPIDGTLIGIKVTLNQTRTYENTNNTYTIVGVIEVNLKQNTETHNITVSGGKFKDPQTCS